MLELSSLRACSSCKLLWLELSHLPGLQCRGFGTQWDVFFDQIEELATRVPVQVVQGNHVRTSCLVSIISRTVCAYMHLCAHLTQLQLHLWAVRHCS